MRTSTRPQVITKDKTLWRNLGTAYANNGKLDQARDGADRPRASSIRRTREVRALLGTVQRKLKRQQGRDRRPRDGREAQARRAASGGTTSASRIGSTTAIDDAIKAYEKAIELAPNEARYHFDLGVAWRRKDDPDKAIPDYEKATEPRPGVRRRLVRSRLHVQAQQRERQGDRRLAEVPRAQQGQGPRRRQKRIEEEMTSIGGAPGEDARRSRAEEGAAEEEVRLASQQRARRRTEFRGSSAAKPRKWRVGGQACVVSSLDADQLAVGRGDRSGPASPQSRRRDLGRSLRARSSRTSRRRARRARALRLGADHRARRACRARLRGRARAGPRGRARAVRRTRASRSRRRRSPPRRTRTTRSISTR